MDAYEDNMLSPELVMDWAMNVRAFEDGGDSKTK